MNLRPNNTAKNFNEYLLGEPSVEKTEAEGSARLVRDGHERTKLSTMETPRNTWRRSARGSEAQAPSAAAEELAHSQNTSLQVSFI